MIRYSESIEGTDSTFGFPSLGTGDQGQAPPPPPPSCRHECWLASPSALVYHTYNLVVNLLRPGLDVRPNALNTPAKKKTQIAPPRRQEATTQQRPAEEVNSQQPRRQRRTGSQDRGRHAHGNTPRVGDCYRVASVRTLQRKKWMDTIPPWPPALTE